MPEHKFEFIVSGMDMSEDMKSAISASIAQAVTGVIVAQKPGRLGGPIWAGGVGPINGGRLLLGADADKLRTQLQKSLPALGKG